MSLLCKGATSIKLLHNGSQIAQVLGAGGLLDFSSALLGIGATTVQPAATTALGPTEKLGPGLELTVGGETPVVVKDTFDGGWLAKLIKGASQHFTLTAVIEVAKPDLYQMQLKTNTGASVQIDGLSIVTAVNDRQMYAPVALQPGLHRLKVLGIAPQGAVMDIRFGAAGILHLAEPQWKHVIQ
jgi:hypothetical protein